MRIAPIATMTTIALACAGVFAPAALEAQSWRGSVRVDVFGGGRASQSPCRVWYGDRARVRQSAPMSCRAAEAIAARNRSARVIYPAGSAYPSGRSPRTSAWRDAGPAFHTGYADGYDKGFDDGDDRDRFDPTRHGRYRAADHGYAREYGSRQAYRDQYREGFLSGYEEGYRGGDSRRRW